ncbi:uncharacterized protein [Diadema setosum]|uniref:uncharacterized protein n=1 Tax=Diadema setosum TaxID=31175 RepID=UPI003B3B86BD
MAESRPERDSSQNLLCPLCLDIFDDPTLLECKHTFCRRCLQQYDKCHSQQTYMVCPLCRESTTLQDGRVESLPANNAIKGLADDFRDSLDGLNTIFEDQSQCTACKSKEVAVSFCYECDNHMCEKCHHCHEHLSSLFLNHHVVSMQDVSQGKASIQQQSEKCLVHRQEKKDLFCEQCAVHVCLKCVIVAHRDHKIKNLQDFEGELQEKVNDLSTQCKTRKSEYEKNIHELEMRRKNMHDSFQKFRSEVRAECSKRIQLLQEREQTLIRILDEMHASLDEELDHLKTCDRQKIKNMATLATLITTDRDKFKQLEAESLAAHSLLCRELEDLLKINADPSNAKHVEESACSDVMAFSPFDSTVDIGKMKLTIKVDVTISLPDTVLYLTAKSANTVAVGYSNVGYIDVIDLSDTSTRKQLPNCPSYSPRFSVAFQKNGTLVTSTGSSYSTVYRYSPDGSSVENLNLSGPGVGSYFPAVNIGVSGDIIIANGSNQVYIFDPTEGKLKLTVNTKENTPMQGVETKSQLLVTSSCYITSPSVVTVYDKEGNAGNSVKGLSGEYLYVAVDDKDRVYVANVTSSRLRLSIYIIEGLDLKEWIQFEDIQNLNLNNSRRGFIWLSSGRLALSCLSRLYLLWIPRL